MSRAALAALLLATACASTSGHGPGDAGPGAPPPPVAYGGEILHLDADRYAQLSADSSRAAGHFSWPEIARQTAEVYAAALSRVRKAP